LASLVTADERVGWLSPTRFSSEELLGLAFGSG
jgi:hypothetical protein